MSREVRAAAWSSEERSSFSYGAILSTTYGQYPEARTEDMTGRRQIELNRSTASALAGNEAAAREPLDLPYSPTFFNVEGCRYVVSSDDELFGNDS